ncbi:hypothetical protein BC332_20760 [Capsicum chinense]|nr:hypothetical protein BC332_20760 [Capsicum chinense]
MPHVLNVWMYECCSEVDGTIAERVGNVIPRIFNWKVVGIKVKYEKFMASMFSKFVYTNLRPTHEEVQRLDLTAIDVVELNNDESALSHDTYPDRSEKSMPIDQSRTSDSERLDSPTLTPSSFDKSGHQDSSVQKWNELKFFLQSYDQQDQDMECLQKEDVPSKEQDFEGFSSDVETSTLDAHVEEMVNQEIEDIGTVTLNALVDAVVNQNSDYSKDEYLSILSESAQLEIDAIMQGLAALVDDIPLEVVKSVDETINFHSLSDSQILSNYPDSVVAAHLTAKSAAKRTRTRSRIFKSPYMTDFASGSKALEDESTEFKQTFTFEGYGISEDMPSSIIEEYKKWVLEGLLKFHSKKKMNDEHYKAKTSFLGVQKYDFVVAHAHSKNWFYLMSQKNSCRNDEDYAESVVITDNENAVNNIIKEFSIPAELLWHLVDEVYVPMNYNQNFHWVLVVITLKDRHWPNLDAYRDKLSDTTQLLNTNPFEVEYVQNISQQDCDSLDCGVFVAGYAECISEGMSVPTVGFEEVYHRMRYASLLKNYGF